MFVFFLGLEQVSVEAVGKREEQQGGSWWGAQQKWEKGKKSRQRKRGWLLHQTSNAIKVKGHRGCQVKRFWHFAPGLLFKGWFKVQGFLEIKAVTGWTDGTASKSCTCSTCKYIMSLFLSLPISLWDFCANSLPIFQTKYVYQILHCLWIVFFRF